jgi:hypothetical protein
MKPFMLVTATSGVSISLSVAKDKQQGTSNGMYKQEAKQSRRKLQRNKKRTAGSCLEH